MKEFSSRCVPSLVLICLLGLPAALHAQVSGQLHGTVVDATDSLVPGVTITLRIPGGQTAQFTTITNATGQFSLASLPPVAYDLIAELPGFKKLTLTGVKVDPGRDLGLAPLKLEVSPRGESVTVEASNVGVQTTDAVVASTLTNRQMQDLPMLNRSPLALIQTQAGVSLGRGNTVINGQRTSYANVTLDGINIQDNFLRQNSLDFSPNLLLLDQIAEVTITTSNGDSGAGFGGAQVAYSTPSGTNKYRGSVYWYNRNSALAANDWFNNRDGIKKPQLNQNQAGGTFSGPIFKDKLTFYTNYELIRRREQSAADRTILTADARNGIFTYQTAAGVQKVNVLQAMGISADPTTAAIIAKIPTPDKVNQFRNGDSSSTLLRNTAGYSFVRSVNRTRDNVTNKVDFHPADTHSFAVTYAWNRDVLDRPDVNSLGYSVKAPVANDEATNLLSASWRWSPLATLTNEVRGGFNLAPARFLSSEEFGSAIIAPTLISNPLNTFRTQGRDTNTYNFSDVASWLHGRHNIQMGFQAQIMRTAPYDQAGITPTYTLGMGTGNVGLSSSQLPGASSTDIASANSLLALLGGYVTSYSQLFNAKDRTSGFVSGAENLRHFSFDQYGLYLQDKWKLLRGLTLTGGLRYDYFTVVDERDSLALLPKLVNNDPRATLLSNATFDFAGGSVGRPWYNNDRMNFAPHAGLVWDVFGDGRMSVRSGYSLYYVNDQYIASIQNSAATAPGLASTVTGSGLSGRLSGGLPAIPTPVFKVPRTQADNYAISNQSALAVPDPNLRTPYVQEWNLGVQYDLKRTLIEVRYVGNHSTGQFRGYDYNQVLIRENGFLADFQKAQSNLNLARAAGKGNNPAYDSTLAGSQVLTVFPNLASGGLLTNATIRNLIDQGQPGELALTYQINNLAGSVNFFQNPLALGANVFSNNANSTYHSLQAEVKRRMRGVDLQANYTFSKVLANTTGTNQSNFEALLDNANPQLEAGRAPYDLAHSFKANGVYDLPVGDGHWVSFGRIGNQFLGGWRISSILNWQSGVPFSILSGRGTVNRASRSGSNTANTLLNMEQLGDIVKFRMAADGPYIIAASAINSTAAAGPLGAGVAADGTAPFTGQVFFHPTAGTNGTLQRRVFTGPSAFGMDIALAKTISVRESQDVEVRMESFNILNHPTFNVGDQSIGSTNFGKITGTFGDRRIIQLSMHYRFK